MPQLRNTK